MANRKIKESFAKTKFSTTLKNICGDKVIATADTIADLNYNATLADGTVTEGAYQSEVNKLHADAIEELKNSKANVAFNSKDIAYDDAMKVFEFADNIDTSNYSTIILRGVLDAEGKETDVLDCTPITMENCTYVVKRTFTLTQDLVLPKNSCLCFEGGCIRADESHWITGVFAENSEGSTGYYFSSFTIQNNTGHPIIGENVLLDVPYHNTFMYSWFVNVTAFFKNAEAVTQLQRDFNIMGVHLCLDVPKVTCIIEESINFNPPSTRAKNIPFIIVISTSYTLSYRSTFISGDFMFSSYDEETDDYKSVVLLLNNVYVKNTTNTPSLIMYMMVNSSNYYGRTKVVQIIMTSRSTVKLSSDILPNRYVTAQIIDSYLTSNYPILVMESYNSDITSNLIGTEASQLTNCTLKGSFETEGDCIISNCIFNTLDTDKYYSDDAEAKGIYFYNCLLNNTPLDSYNRFKVIE
jgi:hypothetical protein